MKALILSLSVLLTACGGQPASAKPLNICMQPTDRIVAMANCDAILWPTPELDPAKSAAMQAAQGPAVIGWIAGDMAPDKVTTQGAITKSVVARAPALIAEMAKYPNIGWIFAQDEIGWCDTKTCLYDYMPQLAYIAKLTHAVGKKVLVSIPPGVLTQYPDTFASGINEIDAIAFDIYPSIPFPADFGGCTFNANPYSTALKCSVERVRRMGYTGAIVYAAQCFKMRADDDTWLRAQLTLQQETLRNATALGADAVLMFGCNSDAYLERFEPNLVPLNGTQYQVLVTP